MPDHIFYTTLQRYIPDYIFYTTLQRYIQDHIFYTTLQQCYIDEDDVQSICVLFVFLVLCCFNFSLIFFVITFLTCHKVNKSKQHVVENLRGISRSFQRGFQIFLSVTPNRSIILENLYKNLKEKNHI